MYIKYMYHLYRVYADQLSHLSQWHIEVENKMAAILQTTFSNSFFLMKMCFVQISSKFVPKGFNVWDNTAKSLI